MNLFSQPVTPVRPIQGIDFSRLQLQLAAIGLAIVGVVWLFLGHLAFKDVFETLFSTFIVGNCTAVSIGLILPVFAGLRFPWDLLSLLATVIPVNVVGGYLALVVARLVLQQDTEKLFHFDSFSIRSIIFFSLVITVPFYLSSKNRARLEKRNRELESQVILGQTELKTQAEELRAANEIQTHLLPLEIPRIKGFEVACAWQPAQSVGGDYFDVLAVSPGQIGICLADVSGKGMSAALLMANLQALVRAFAPGVTGPGALCLKVNESLCASVAPGKFVTFFYGVIDSNTLMLRFENAGHGQPIVLREDMTILLTEGSTVLGLFPNVQYEERRFLLRSGDCLLLTTDGITEATNEADEEFGTERVAASALAARSLRAQGIRTRIMEDVSSFCNGKFHDDASLIVVTVD
jgi:sigma-B regulation protein RsbU (phosphoserine phosphatase)